MKQAEGSLSSGQAVNDITAYPIGKKTGAACSGNPYSAVETLMAASHLLACCGV
jgi:hypothetical protein